MKFRPWFFTVVLSCACACAQQASSSGFNRPPAGVDEAVRERIRQFYELEQQGRFRQAEALVCEDSKDRYYDMEKRRWTSVEVIQITYEENFTLARALVILGTVVNTFSGPMPMKAPMTSLWRQEGGEWCRHIPPPPKEGIPTPFGVMKSSAGQQAPPPGMSPAEPRRMPTSMEDLQSLVKVSRTQVTLPLSGGTEEVEITNGMPGDVELRLVAPSVPGFEAVLSNAAIPGGGKATLKLSFAPREGAAPPPQLTVRVVAEPIGAEKYVRVEFRK